MFSFSYLPKGYCHVLKENGNVYTVKLMLICIFAIFCNDWGSGRSGEKTQSLHAVPKRARRWQRHHRTSSLRMAATHLGCRSKMPPTIYRSFFRFFPEKRRLGIFPASNHLLPENLRFRLMFYGFDDDDDVFMF